MDKKNIWPPEWQKHIGTLLAWPTNNETWKHLKPKIQEDFIDLIEQILKHEMVYLSNTSYEDREQIIHQLIERDAGIINLKFIEIKNNDSWARDFGPICVKNENQVVFQNFKHNAWGGKYPPFDDDDKFNQEFVQYFSDYQLNSIDMVLEGGSIEHNGQGVLLTTKQCLLNKNRNPHLTIFEIENNLKQYLGVEDIIWLDDGIKGDDTDGHIDDFARFIDEKNIVIPFEDDPHDDNYEILKSAYETLMDHPVVKKHDMKIHKLPMPKVQCFEGERLPASYANFYFTNGTILLPVFNCENDDKAISILSGLRPDRKIVPIDCSDIIMGLGAIHCLTMQIF